MKFPTIKQIILRIAITIALIELAIMIVFLNMPSDLGMYTQAMLDTVLLAMFSTPIIYSLIIKPFVVAHETRIANILANAEDAYLTLDRN